MTMSRRLRVHWHWHWQCESASSSCLVLQLVVVAVQWCLCSTCCRRHRSVAYRNAPSSAIAACTRPTLAIQRKTRRAKANDAVQPLPLSSAAGRPSSIRASDIQQSPSELVVPSRASAGLERQLLPLSIMHHELALANIAIRLTVRAFRSSEAQL